MSTETEKYGNTLRNGWRCDHETKESCDAGEHVVGFGLPASNCGAGVTHPDHVVDGMWCSGSNGV